MIETFDPDRYCRAVLQIPHDEAHVQAAILRELERRGIQAWHLDAGGRQTRRRLAREGLRLGGGGYSDIPEGWPDIFGLLPNGRALFVECKRPGCIVNAPSNPTFRNVDRDLSAVALDDTPGHWPDFPLVAPDGAVGVTVDDLTACTVILGV